MTAGRPDPYRTLGVPATASDAELRAAYRRLVQLHHPDHNAGSPESARRFEAVQEAYAEVRRQRATAGGGGREDRGSHTGSGQRDGRGAQADGRPGGPGGPQAGRGTHAAGGARDATAAGTERVTDARLADMEREIRQQQEAWARARRAAAVAASASATGSGARAERGDGTASGATAAGGPKRPPRPTDEELGYITTNDSLSQILADARSGAAQRIAQARGPVARRVADLLDGLADKLGGDEGK